VHPRLRWTGYSPAGGFSDYPSDDRAMTPEQEPSSGGRLDGSAPDETAPARPRLKRPTGPNDLGVVDTAVREDFHSWRGFREASNLKGRVLAESAGRGVRSVYRVHLKPLTLHRE